MLIRSRIFCILVLIFVSALAAGKTADDVHGDVCQSLLQFRISHQGESGKVRAVNSAGLGAGRIDFTFTQGGRVLLHSVEVSEEFRNQGVYRQLAKVLTGMHPHAERVAAFLERDNLAAYLDARKPGNVAVAVRETPFYKVYAAAGFSRIEFVDDRLDDLGSVYIELARDF